MARLQIKWDSQSSVAPTAATTGDTNDAKEEKTSSKRFADRPMMVYVMADDNTDSNTRKLEDICFADERVGIGSKFFQCIKITNGNALQDRILSENGKDSPRIVLMTRDYDVLEVLEGKKISSGRLVKAMSKCVRKEYKDSFDSMVSKYAKLLNELDRLEGVKSLLADKRNRAGNNEAKLKKIEREQKEFEADMEKWKKAEEKLLAFKIKKLKAPKA